MSCIEQDILNERRNIAKLISITDTSYQKLSQLAKEHSISHQVLLDSMIEKAERKIVFDKADKSYEAAQKNRESWQEELKERMLWELILEDGLDDI